MFGPNLVSGHLGPLLAFAAYVDDVLATERSSGNGEGNGDPRGRSAVRDPLDGLDNRLVGHACATGRLSNGAPLGAGNGCCASSARPENRAASASTPTEASAPQGSAAPSRDLSLRLSDVREYPSEALDHVLTDGRTVQIYGPSASDPLGQNDEPPARGRPVAVILLIAEYRRLCGLSHAMAEMASEMQAGLERAVAIGSRAMMGAGR